MPPPPLLLLLFRDPVALTEEDALGVKVRKEDGVARTRGLPVGPPLPAAPSNEGLGEGVDVPVGRAWEGDKVVDGVKEVDTVI